MTVEVFGLPYRHAGDVLDVAEGTVKSRVHRARRALIAWFAVAAPNDGRSGETGRGD
ncbi:MAG TPA: sigma factor-like helix-turn-helix DNA-binding protein [Acidimicrobiia bacterium]|nr:sigma factor-like helix-turn-helix DNA-binding protein [Acidimicrobiia bacterium]